MRKAFLLAASLLFILNACKKSDDDNNQPSFATSPETKPEFVNTSFGVYKGLLVEAAGSMKIVINNGDNVAGAYIYKNGVVSETLVTSYTFVPGADIINAHFAGPTTSFDLSVSDDGSDPVITNVVVPGAANAKMKVFHEGGILVYCYEGGFSGDDHGIFKCMINGSQVIGYVISDITDELFTANAVATAGHFDAIFGGVSSGATFSGNFNATGCSGNWNNQSAGESGSFSGPRTL